MNKVLVIGLMFLMITFLSCKNTVVETQVHVWGSCDLAKTKIDSAAKLEGVIKADWNKDTKLLTIKFDSSKVSLDQILKSVSMAGFDNEGYFADDYAYNKLPLECQYERRSD